MAGRDALAGIVVAALPLVTGMPHRRGRRLRDPEVSPADQRLGVAMLIPQGVRLLAGAPGTGAPRILAGWPGFSGVYGCVSGGASPRGSARRDRTRRDRARITR
jgi:hypothetical protein